MAGSPSPGLYEHYEALLALPESARAAGLAALLLPDAQADLLRAMLRVDPDQIGALPEMPLAAALDVHGGYAAGQRVGSFELGPQLGSGGMGQVFAATRTDDTAQRVAIKVQLPILANDETLRRFRLERQVLAGLEHPAIARLIESGEDTEGRPYFAMEWVDGLTIDAHCDAHALGLRARAQLFLRLCEGVDYAHRHLVVHRDIKPGNVMVNVEGQPKLLDFGIAKPLDARTGDAHGTATHARVFSPSSAAPEQVRGESISVGCDVYALGALLYELLSGSPPYQLKGLTPTQIEAKICDVPPLPPSEQVERLRRSVPATAEALARQRGFSRSRALIAALRGDLDRIVLQALRKRPQERYPSVAALQADVQRWLNGEAVWARGMGRLYRLRKLVGRHRVVSVLLGAWLVGLSVITPVLWLQASALQRERDEVRRQWQQAEQERRLAEQVTAFIEQTFALADPGRARGDALSVSEVLDTASRALQLHHIDHPGLQHRLQMSLVRVMLSLGRPAEAAAVLAIEPAGLEPTEALQRTRALAEVALSRADGVQALSHSAAAVQALAEAAHTDPETAARVWLTRAHALRASQPAGAMQAIDRTLDHLRHLPQVPADLRSSVSSLRARLWLAEGRAAEGMQELQALLHWQRSHLPAHHPALLETLRLLTVQANQTGAYEQALGYVQEQLDLATRVFGEHSLRVAHALNARGSLQMERGRAETAIADYRRSHDLLVQRLGPHHSHVAQVLYNLGEVERLLRQAPVQAQSYYRQAIAIAAQRPGQPVPALFRLGLGSSLLEQGRWSEAAAEIDAVLAISATRGGALHALALGERALLELGQGQTEAARRSWAGARPLLEAEIAPSSPARQRLERKLAQLGS